MTDWREYEEEIFELLKAKAMSDARVEFDIRLPGHLSGVDRQVDVYVEGLVAGGVMPGPATLAVDCKCWSSKVDVADVERFIANAG